MKDPALQGSAPNESLVWQLVAKLDEQRRYPRVPLNLAVALVTASGAKCKAHAINISPDGFQLRCDVDAARLLHPAGGKVDPEHGPRVTAALKLEVHGQQRTLVARCRLLYLTTVDTEPRCVIGLRFSALDQQAESTVGAFFADQLAMESEVA